MELIEVAKILLVFYLFVCMMSHELTRGHPPRWAARAIQATRRPVFWGAVLCLVAGIVLEIF